MGTAYKTEVVDYDSKIQQRTDIAGLPQASIGIFGHFIWLYLLQLSGNFWHLESWAPFS